MHTTQTRGAGAPLVSVIICAHNAGRYLRPSLQSVLDQSYQNLEVIVVDDGSTDGSTAFLDEVKDERVRVMRQENSGKSVALNCALDCIAGKYYAIHDADDLSSPLRFERQVEHLETEPDLGAVFCGHELLLENRRCAPRFRPKNCASCKADIETFRMPAHDPTVMYRTAMVKGFRYEPLLRIGQGYDYILRVGEQFPMAVIGECLYSYRIHQRSMTKTDPDKRADYILQVLERACERRSVPFDEQFSREQWLRQNTSDDNGLAANFIESAVDLRDAGQLREAIRTGLLCAAQEPLHANYYKALAYVLMPERLRRVLRPSEQKIFNDGPNWYA